VHIQIIDQDQADGILIRTPNEQWIVIDAGTNERQAQAMKNAWGVDKVALAVVSHRHDDHLGGMDEILHTFPTERFLGLLDDCVSTDAYNDVRTVIRAKNIPVVPLDTAPIEIDGVHFTLLPPPEHNKCQRSENNNSLVVRLDYGEFSMLFTGDSEKDELDFLVANHQELLDVDILKASHHGAANGFTDDFLQKVSPEQVVISAGVHSKYQHPHSQAVLAYEAATGGKVYCTNRHKTIHIFGYQNGKHRVVPQNAIDKSCVYDGTHYGATTSQLTVNQ